MTDLISDIKSSRAEWNSSYNRGENNILYPQAEVIKFLNRFVVKRNSLETTSNVINVPNRSIRCLDFACGVGASSIILKDFNIEGYSVDISDVAISIAQHNAIAAGQIDLASRMFVIDNDNQILKFGNNFFDCVIAESCLDSMPFDFAFRYMQELKRITCGKIYFSLISSKSNNGIVEDKLVIGKHEEGTVQSYYDIDRILKLTACNLQDFVYLRETVTSNYLNASIEDARLYCVLNSHNN